MKCFSSLVLGYFISASLLAQTGSSLTGMVTDRKTNEPLKGASISMYSNGKISGNITNGDGKFSISYTMAIDSIRFSMIGYYNKVFARASINNKSSLAVTMDANMVSLDEVVVQPMSALEIVQRAIKNTMSLLPHENFENTGFYREIIKNREEYLSVAEAVFNTQYFPLDRSYKLRLEKGRSKEDVTATRLFEDFHPGGGPEALSEFCFNTGFPDFLTLEKMKWFDYRKDSVTVYDGRTLYNIGFDQKRDIHKALDKGKIFIDAEDYSIVRYEASNSPTGMPYIKNLKGTDKLVAELLHIDFKRKGWVKEASFKKNDDKILMDHAKETYYISYKQPKKDLDLDMSIATELLITDNYRSITKPITSSDEWKRKNIIANLPTDFDNDFWGNNNIISPTAQVENIIASIGRKNKDDSPGTLNAQWLYHQRNTFVTTQKNDSITLIPIIKSNWEDGETGGMLFREVTGDFTVETAVSLTRRSNTTEIPDKGFQQSGIILRNGKLPGENNIILSIGTGGNAVPKFFLRKTENGKSKSTVDKIDTMSGWLKLEKKATTVTAFFRKNNNTEWQTINSYPIKWLNDSLQVGMSVMARFAGSGPKMKPDMKAIFTNFSIIKNDGTKVN